MAIFDPKAASKASGAYSGQQAGQAGQGSQYKPPVQQGQSMTQIPPRQDLSGKAPDYTPPSTNPFKYNGGNGGTGGQTNPFGKRPEGWQSPELGVESPTVFGMTGQDYQSDYQKGQETQSNFIEAIAQLMGQLGTQDYSGQANQIAAQNQWKMGNDMNSLNNALAAAGMGGSGLQATGLSGLQAQSQGEYGAAMNDLQQKMYQDELARAGLIGNLAMGGAGAVGNQQQQALADLLGRGNLDLAQAQQAFEQGEEFDLAKLISLFNMAMTKAESDSSFKTQQQAAQGGYLNDGSYIWSLGQFLDALEKGYGG